MVEIRLTHERLSEEPICRYIFGNFIESGFGRQTSGMWAEMLYNRGFQEVPPYKKTTWEALRLDPDHYNASAPFWHSGYEECDWELLAPDYSKKWRTHGTDSFKGCGSLAISPHSGGKRAGLRQRGIYFQAGRGYRFSIFGGFAVYWGKKVSAPKVTDSVFNGLALETRIVSISLREEGHEENILFHRQLHFGCLQRQFDLDILLPGYTGRVVLEIGFKWDGDLLLSWCSLMPLDHIKGWRSDVIALLKEVGLPVIRFPGGCFASFSDWRDTVGPRHQRTPLESYFWGGLDENDVGIDEYLDLCSEIGAEPQVCVNMMTSTPFKAAELVEYCNGMDSSAMGRFRKENGVVRRKKVTFWEMENEPSRKWSALQYAHKIVEFAKAMRSVDEDIRLMMAYYDFDQSLYWLPQMLAIAGKHIDYVIHRERSKPVIEQALAILKDYNRKHGTSIKHVNTEWLSDPDAPEPFEDEDVPQKYDWSDGWNDYRKTISFREIRWFYALNAAHTLLDFISLGGEFSLANFNNCVNTWGQNIVEASKEGSWLSPAGHVFKFFRNFNGKFPLKTKSSLIDKGLIHVQACEIDDQRLVVYMINHGKTPQEITLILPEGFATESQETIFAANLLSTCRLERCEILSEQATIMAQDPLSLKPLSLSKVECHRI